ncbi:MAG TPA: hypothetical protein VHH91_07255, partial [Vicinamibacterales bacterium]|nr:hypothetical protein [Vicinamibacterales bacterium]
MLAPRLVALETRGDLVQLEPSVGGLPGQSPATRVEPAGGQRPEPARHSEVLPEHFEAVHPADHGRDRQAERVGEHVARRGDARLDRARVAAE